MPWLGSLLTAGSVAFGRLITVNLLPSALVVAFTWLLVKAKAFSRHTAPLHLRDLQASFRIDSGGVVLFLIVVVAGATLLQAFEIRAVRVLEGYGAPSPLGKVGSRRHRRRLESALEEADLDDDLKRQERVGDDALARLDVAAQARRRREWAADRRLAERARRRLPHYPEDPSKVMPTLLGNELRAAEGRAGERYYLSTVHTMPRLYPHLSPRLSAAYQGALDTLDASAMQSVTFTAMAAEGVVAFYDDPKLLWIPLGLLLLAVGFYRGALVAAVQQGALMEVAFDLHRFDLLEELHQDLPDDAVAEQQTAETLADFWSADRVTDARDAWRHVHYTHPGRQPGSRGAEPASSDN